MTFIMLSMIPLNSIYFLQTDHEVFTDQSKFEEEFLPKLKQMSHNFEEKSLDFVGCTANICYLENKTGKAIVANLGDSRAVSCQKSIREGSSDFEVVTLSNDHKPENQEEMERIEKA